MGISHREENRALEEGGIIYVKKDFIKLVIYVAPAGALFLILTQPPTTGVVGY